MSKRNLGKQFTTGQVGIDLPMFVDAEELADFAVADYSPYGWSNDEMHTALHGTPAPADVDRGQLVRDFKLRESKLPMEQHTTSDGQTSLTTPSLVDTEDGRAPSGQNQLDYSLYDAIERGEGTFPPVKVGVNDAGKMSFEDGYHRTLSAADVAKKQGKQRFVPVNYVDNYEDD